MRNLGKYPVTLSEIEDALLKEAERIEQENRCGDMRPVLFRAAATTLKRLEFTTYRFGQ